MINDLYLYETVFILNHLALKNGLEFRFTGSCHIFLWDIQSAITIDD